MYLNKEQAIKKSKPQLNNYFFERNGKSDD